MGEAVLRLQSPRVIQSWTWVWEMVRGRNEEHTLVSNNRQPYACIEAHAGQFGALNRLRNEQECQ